MACNNLILSYLCTRKKTNTDSVAQLVEHPALREGPGLALFENMIQ